MPQKSIRQFADDLGVSHNTVRTAIKDLESDLSIIIGESQGKGRPTYLSDDEQALIRQRLNPPVKPHSQVSIVPYVPTELEKDSLDSSITLATYQTVDVDLYTSQLTTQLETNITNVGNNTKALDSALLTKLQNEGQLLGVKMFEAKYGTAFNTLQNLETMTAKKQGLVQEIA